MATKRTAAVIDTTMMGIDMASRISARFTLGSCQRRRQAVRFSLRCSRSCSRIHRGTRKGGAGTPITLSRPTTIRGNITRADIPYVKASRFSNAPMLSANSVTPIAPNANKNAGIMYRKGTRSWIFRGQLAEDDGVSNHLIHRTSAISERRPPRSSQIFMPY